MSSQIVKPSTLPGFMELLPSDQILFNRMLDTIRLNYEKYGFIPIDTPMIEKSEVLLAKGGGDTEKQVYRFNKGDSDLSLRFDLTVPLARYVAQHFSSLIFPFRRYQIGKVFRGERNQKGRFREFYQCDIDIIGNGTLSIMNDAEIPAVIYSTFKDLNFGPFTIGINNRKLLNGFFESQSIDNKADVLRIIDKIDKIGRNAVASELENLGLLRESVDRIMEFIGIGGTNKETLSALGALGIDNPSFNDGLRELSQVVEYIGYFNVPEENYAINLTIARGLDYYTGTIYETILNEYPEIGSICSGGRYDNLAEYYTTQKLPGVGISIGLTRLFYQLRDANIIGDGAPSTLSRALIIPMDNSMGYSMNAANMLRESGIPAELYLDDAKTGKKFAYADKLGIPYVIISGPDEERDNLLTLKNMGTGEQSTLSFEETVKKIKSGR
jgi:histidyl-tRNA synthetase